MCREEEPAVRPSEALRQAHRDGVIQVRGRLPLFQKKDAKKLEMCAIKAVFHYAPDVAQEMAWPYEKALHWNDHEQLSFTEIADRLEGLGW